MSIRKNLAKKVQIVRSAIKLFAKYGFYNTKIEEIASSTNISAGSIYVYFPSKKKLAHYAVTHVSELLTAKLREINDQKCSTKEKLEQFVASYLQFLYEHQEFIDYFFKVYIGNREIFCDSEDDCGFALASSFIEELRRFVENAKREGVFEDVDFYIAFSIIMGTLGGFTFLKNEKALEMDFLQYKSMLVERIYKALAKC